MPPISVNSSEYLHFQMKSRLHLNIGLLYDKVNPDMSVKYLKRALEESKGNNDYAIHHLALLQLCETHLLSGELSQALLFGQQVSVLSNIKSLKCLI